MVEAVGEPISSEEGLWALLQRLSDDPELAAEMKTLKIEGWQPQLLYFPDEAVGHSLRPALARAVMEFHASLSRAYALVVYGEPNRQLLKNEDRELLDLMFLVTDGSNGIETMGDAITQLVEGMIGKMSGRQILIAIIVVLVLYFGVGAAKDFYMSVLEQKDLDRSTGERISLSREETERMRLLTEVMQKFGVSPELKSESDEALKALTRPAMRESRSVVRGVEITKEQAEMVVKPDRQEREGRRLDGTYKVIDINTETTSGFFVRIQNTKTGDEFTAQANYDELTEEDIHIIFQVAENKTEFRGLVNAFYIGERVSQAFIVRADPVESDDELIEQPE